MRLFLAVITVLFLSTLAFGQSTETTPKKQDSSVSNPQVADFSLLRRKFRPKLTLQSALKIAEDYIEKERVDVSRYFLSEVRMIQYGSEKDVKEPRWFFVWVNESGGIGNQIEISVSMDGQVGRHPTM